MGVPLVLASCAQPVGGVPASALEADAVCNPEHDPKNDAIYVRSMDATDLAEMASVYGLPIEADRSKLRISSPLDDPWIQGRHSTLPMFYARDGGYYSKDPHNGVDLHRNDWWLEDPTVVSPVAGYLVPSSGVAWQQAADIWDEESHAVVRLLHVDVDPFLEIGLPAGVERGYKPAIYEKRSIPIACHWSVF